MTEEQKTEYEHWLKCIGKVVAMYRRQKGLTQREAAKRAGLNVKFYQDIEYGRRPVTTRTMFQMCKGMGIPVPFSEAIKLICV